MTAIHRRQRRSAWLAGLVVGGYAGFLVGRGPVIGAVLLAGFVIPASRSRQRRAAASGLLVGLASFWLILMAVANANCSTFDAVPNQGCQAPDLAGWVIVAADLLIVGLAVTINLARGPRRGEDQRP